MKAAAAEPQITTALVTIAASHSEATSVPGAESASSLWLISLPNLHRQGMHHRILLASLRIECRKWARYALGFFTSLRSFRFRISAANRGYGDA